MDTNPKPGLCLCADCIRNHGLPPYESFEVAAPSPADESIARYSGYMPEAVQFARSYGFTIVEVQLLTIANDYGWTFPELAAFVRETPVHPHGPNRTPDRMAAERAFYDRWAAAMRAHPGRPLS